MRIVIDLQGAQTESRFRGIGRYSMSIAKAIARNSGEHEIIIALSDRFPDTIMSIREEFKGLVPRDKIVVFSVPGPVAERDPNNSWRARTAELIREHFLAFLKPDMVLITSVFEGFVDDAVVSVKSFTDSIPTAVIFYDFIPYLNPEKDLDVNINYKLYCNRKIESLKKADLLLAISERSASEALDALSAKTEKVVNIYTASEKDFNFHAIDEIQSVKSTLEKSHTNEDQRQPLIKHRLNQTKKFYWDDIAKKAIAAMEETAVNKSSIMIETTSEQKKRKLAYVSPLPPERTGIADYSAELIPYLLNYYDIELIVDQSEWKLPEELKKLPVKNIKWFIKNSQIYDRVVYQIGNSHFHARMVNMIEGIPGVVVLHDLFLSHLIHWLDISGCPKNAFKNVIYKNHGYKSLLYLEKYGYDETKYMYPCSGTVIEDAIGVIFHSKFSSNEAKKYYEVDAEHIVMIPLVKTTDQITDKVEIRKLLGIKEKILLICSFGMMTTAKLSHRLINAFLSSNLLMQSNAQLIFVGENPGDEYVREIMNLIKNNNLDKRITITGYVNHEQFKRYQQASDIAVQLRTKSRGETSKAVLDVLSFGIPTIINANGSMAEYPNDILIKLDDEFTDEELIKALNILCDDGALRERLSNAGSEYVKKYHDPAKIAKDYYDAVENFFENSSAALYKKVIAQIAEKAVHADYSAIELINISKSLSINCSQSGLKKLFVDVSTISRNDLKTGIERVTRNILLHLINNPPQGFLVEPVYAREDAYFYARRYTKDFLEIKGFTINDEPIDIKRGDVFFGLDWAPVWTVRMKSYLKKLKIYGVRVSFFIHDILPATNPEWFPSSMHEPVKKWLEAIRELADSCICVSKSSADALVEWMISDNHESMTLPVIKWSHNGADHFNVNEIGKLKSDESKLINSIINKNSFLMVGTIEPRKMHAFVLDAFEYLWSDGHDVNLVIVGFEGWKGVVNSERRSIIDFIKRLENHHEKDKRLFWLNGINDDFLSAIYKSCSSLISASVGEGFGLPLIEAAQHKLPIIARNIPVFREVAGDYAYYFRNSNNPQVLADTIIEWARLFEKGEHPKSDDMPWLTWEESVERLKQIIIYGNW